MIRIAFDPDTGTATVEHGDVIMELVDVELSFRTDAPASEAGVEPLDGWMRWKLEEPRRRAIILAGLVRPAP